MSKSLVPSMPLCPINAYHSTKALQSYQALPRSMILLSRLWQLENTELSKSSPSRIQTPCLLYLDYSTTPLVPVLFIYSLKIQTFCFLFLMVVCKAYCSLNYLQYFLTYISSNLQNLQESFQLHIPPTLKKQFLYNIKEKHSGWTIVLYFFLITL